MSASFTRYFNLNLETLSPIPYRQPAESVPQPIPVHITAQRRLSFDRSPIKMEPLEGPWAVDALKMIDIPYLTSVPGNQMYYWDIRKETDSWLHMADLLQIAPGQEEYRLRLLQEHCAAKRPDLRCPCVRGARCPEPEDHWPGYQQGQVIERQREQEAERRQQEQDQVAAETLAKQLRRQQQEQLERVNAAHVAGVWGHRLARVLSDDELIRISRDCTNELARRLENAHH